MLDHQIVERAVLLAVHRLLADEGRDVGEERGVVDLTAVLFNGVDEELFALRKQKRERVEKGGREGVVVTPVAGHVLGVEIELDIAALQHGTIMRSSDGSR